MPILVLKNKFVPILVKIQTFTQIFENQSKFHLNFDQFFTHYWINIIINYPNNSLHNSKQFSKSAILNFLKMYKFKQFNIWFITTKLLKSSN